jgi:hypothetical protein
MNYETFLHNGYLENLLIKKRADQLLSFSHQFPTLHFHLLEDMGQEMWQCKETKRIFRYNRKLRVWSCLK